MSTLTVELQIRDDEPHFVTHADIRGEGGEGHVWFLFGEEQFVVGYKPQCDNCERTATWQRDTVDHPNWVDSISLCGTCAGEILRGIPDAEVWGVLYGTEFGYAWEAPITQDKEGAEL